MQERQRHGKTIPSLEKVLIHQTFKLANRHLWMVRHPSISLTHTSQGYAHTHGRTHAHTHTQSLESGKVSKTRVKLTHHMVLQTHLMYVSSSGSANDKGCFSLNMGRYRTHL